MSIVSPLSSRALRRLTAHREQWAIPQSPWVLAQSWHHLLFAHWPLPPDQLRPLIPPGLVLDTYDGRAWIGVVPFEMCYVHPRGLPSLPLVSFFPELNLRTYVTRDGLPGVWFFSLDADHWPAVALARRAFRLPYYKADMRVQQRGDTLLYQSYRRHPGAANAVFRGAYQPSSEATWSAPGSLEYFLTERYYLYSQGSNGRLYRAAVQHIPWPLQAAEAEITANTMALVQGIDLPDSAPLLHYAHRMDVLTWSLERL